MTRSLIVAVFFASTAVLVQQDPSLARRAPSAQAPRPGTAIPYAPSFDISSMDRGADPCIDLYQHACGGWMAGNPIPPDQAWWSVEGLVDARRCEGVRRTGQLREGSVRPVHDH